jgi:sulfate adenylyltransferase subunit 1
LVDATRVDLNTTPATLLAQTKRHAAIVHLLGLRHVVFAVNKMDLFDFDEKVFNTIKTSIEDLTQKIGLPKPTLIPISALLGANVVTASKNTSWYKGPTLLEWLESLDTSPESEKLALRFPVQYVARQDGSASDDFRGYLGEIESGSIRKGQKIKILPSGSEATVAEIYLGNRASDKQTNGSNAVDFAETGQAVAIQLLEDIDVSRGSLFISAEDNKPPVLSKQLSVDLCWLDSEPLSLSRKYALRHTTNTVGAKVKEIQQVLDVQTLSQSSDVHALSTNEIGRVDFVLQKPIAADLFDQSQRTGAFILIDEATNHTVAAGMIRKAIAQ